MMLDRFDDLIERGCRIFKVHILQWRGMTGNYRVPYDSPMHRRHEKRREVHLTPLFQCSEADSSCSPVVTRTPDPLIKSQVIIVLFALYQPGMSLGVDKLVDMLPAQYRVMLCHK